MTKPLLSLVLLALVGSSAGTLWWVCEDAAATDSLTPPVSIQGSSLRSSARAAAGSSDPASDDPTKQDADSSALVETLDDGTRRIDLAALTFPDYDPPEIRGDGTEALGKEAFPELVRSLDGLPVQAQGYMIATDLAGGAVRKFMLTRFPPGCCFGGVPVLDEWVEVTVPEGRELRFSPYAVVSVKGTLAVGEKLDETGFAESLYRMEGAEISEMR